MPTAEDDCQPRWWRYEENGIVEGIQAIDSADAPDLLANQWRKVTKIRRVTVSTVFLGLDHGEVLRDFQVPLGQARPRPVLWETLVFGGPLGGEQRRYFCKEDAIRGHAEVVQMVRSAWGQAFGKGSNRKP